MLNRDFDHLSTLAHHFFEREDVRQKLNIIDQYNISGWEVWMQIEFANLLASTGHEWWREQTLACDLRKNPQRLSVRADFLLRKKDGRRTATLRLSSSRTRIRQAASEI